MSLSSLVTTGALLNRPLRCLIYSEPKTGKTHLAAGAPGVIFADCEDGALSFDVARSRIREYPQLAELITALRREEHSYRTLVIDTLDSLEHRLCAHLLGHKFRGKDSLADIAFGKGWAAAVSEWRQLVQQLEALQADRGMNLVLLAHAHKGTDSDPHEDEQWREWSLRVNKKTSEFWRGWVEDLLFMRDLRSTNRRSGVASYQGIVLETRRDAAWDAGSRRISVPQVRIPMGEPAEAWRALSRAYRAQVQQPAAEPQAEGVQS